jgi:hypothetical protein
MTDGHKNPDSYRDELIAENKRTRSPFLDLGNPGERGGLKLWVG